MYTSRRGRRDRTLSLSLSLSLVGSKRVGGTAAVSSASAPTPNLEALNFGALSKSMSLKCEPSFSLVGGCLLHVRSHHNPHTRYTATVKWMADSSSRVGARNLQVAIVFQESYSLSIAGGSQTSNFAMETLTLEVGDKPVPR